MVEPLGPVLTAKGAATRARLLAAASEQLRTDGRLEIAVVASRAGVAQSVLYRYFGGKDGLVEAVVHEFYDAYSEAVFDAPLEPEATWVQRERLRLEREVHFLYAHPLGRTVTAGLLHEAAATRADAARQREQALAAARNIRHGQRTGQLDRSVDAGLAGAAIIGALRAMMSDALARDPPPPAQLVVDAAIRLGRALLPEAPAQLS
ncbi:MAG: regulatory protein TetR [Solirubrobacterales bacterium]|nr:regulatory protein TetR [Solirubrobacterales bacterium]